MIEYHKYNKIYSENIDAKFHAISPMYFARRNVNMENRKQDITVH